MEILVLGCYGGELPGLRTTCFRLNGNVLIDAGAVTAALSVEDQVLIDAIILSHSHLDHVRDLGFLVDNTFGMRKVPLKVYGLPETIAKVKEHILNNAVWPDFSVLPTPENPVMVYEEIPENTPIEIEGLMVTAVKVNHTVTTAGFIVTNSSSTVAFSGDTGPTHEFWKAAAREENLKAVFLEVSFPDRLAQLAESSGHLTPSSARAEMQKLDRPDLPVYIYHLKPQYIGEIANEIDSDPRFRIAEQGEEIKV